MGDFRDRFYKFKDRWQSGNVTSVEKSGTERRAAGGLALGGVVGAAGGAGLTHMAMIGTRRKLQELRRDPVRNADQIRRLERKMMTRKIIGGVLGAGVGGVTGSTSGLVSAVNKYQK